MDSFEQWAKLQEDKLKDLTIFLTEFRSFEQFLLGFIVIGILPGIGEELLFRGILQNKLKQLLGNAHIAIWLAAIIFSAFHLQFYGFVPRMLLGALFGYLYQWSGNLIYAMVAHFVNNGFTVIMMYLYQQNRIALDIDKQEVPSDAAFLSLILTALLVLVFYSMASKANPSLGTLTHSKDLNDRY
jgi:membrane protease YdiL (CAAX protease family)